MDGDTGNRDEDLDVRAALKGLNWHDQMEAARALRERKSLQGKRSKDNPSDDDLQPIFKQLKRTRANSAAEANFPAQPEPSAGVQAPVKETHRGMRLEAAVARGKVDADAGQGGEEILAPDVSTPIATKTARIVDDEPCSNTEEYEDYEDYEARAGDALILVSPVMDGEILDKEPDRNPNAIVVTPGTNSQSGWRLVIGFGFGVGLGVGLSIILGVALLGSMFGLTDTDTSASAEMDSTLGETNNQSATLGNVTNKPTAPNPVTMAIAAPIVDTSPPLSLAQFVSASNSQPETADAVYSQSFEVAVALKPRQLAIPTVPEGQPEIPIFVPRPRPNPTRDRAPVGLASTPAPVDAALPGADRYTALLNAPTRLPEAKVEIVAANLRETGISLRPVHRVNFKVGADQVRFYHPEDSGLAASIAELIGAQARDFTDFRPLPPAGNIEIYLAGSGSRATRKQPQAVEPVAALRSLRNKIVRTLNP